MRIVSLLPSGTEIVCALGLGRKLVGISHACDWPPEVVGKQVVTRPGWEDRGGSSRGIHNKARRARQDDSALETLDHDALARLRPDVILTGDGEAAGALSLDELRQVARAVRPESAVIALDPRSIEGIFNAITTVAALTDSEDAAVTLLAQLRERLGIIETTVVERLEAGHRPLRVIALEWLDPPFSAGNWVPEQIRRAGGWELLGSEGEPARPTSWRTIAELDPDMLLLMPCGFHLNEVIRHWTGLRKPASYQDLVAAQRGAVFALDGAALFSRPGPRIIDGIATLAEIFDPAAFVEVAPPNSWTPLE